MPVSLLLAGTAVALGGLVQGLVGFGLALVAVPIVALVEPGLLPVPVLIAATVHAALSFARERADVDWRGVGWALAGRMPGTVIGVVLVDRLAGPAFDLLVGVAVLGSVVLSLVAWRPEPTPRALLVAGVVSGSFGTSMSIGGPPVALLYQGRPGPQVRATLGAFFVLGALVSLSALGVAGQVSGRQLAVGAGLVPFLVAGFAASGPLRRRIDATGLRVPVLALSAGSAVLLIGRSLLGGAAG
jgi:uncharacterized membrane protein YfcA